MANLTKLEEWERKSLQNNAIPEDYDPKEKKKGKKPKGVTITKAIKDLPKEARDIAEEVLDKYSETDFFQEALNHLKLVAPEMAKKSQSETFEQKILFVEEEAGSHLSTKEAQTLKQLLEKAKKAREAKS